MAKPGVIEGSAIFLGDDIDTDLIIAGRYVRTRKLPHFRHITFQSGYYL